MVLVQLLLSESPLHWFEVNSGVRKRGSDENEGDFKLRKTMLEYFKFTTNDSVGTVTDIASVRTKIKGSLTLCIMAVSRIKLL